MLVEFAQKQTFLAYCKLASKKYPKTKRKTLEKQNPKKKIVCSGLSC